MMGRSHFVSGLVTVGVAVLPLPVSLPTKCAAIALGGICAVGPDIDHPSSSISKYFPMLTGPVSWAVQRFSALMFHLTKSEKDPKNAKATHRFFTHTLFFSFLVAALAGFLAFQAHHSNWWVFALAAFVGWNTHIWGDMATLGGCPYLFPVPIDGRRWKAIRSPIPFKTDGFVERKIVLPSLTCLAIMTTSGVIILSLI